MKAGRLVALLLTLQTRRGATAAELAAELEVSVRTIYRDVASLQAAGVPLWTEPGPTGGIRLLDGWRTRLDGLTGDEAAALFLGGVPSALDELGIRTAAVAAQAKVLATLPPELRDRAGRLRERFHLDAPGWFAAPDATPHLATVAAAVWDRHEIEVVYRGEPRRWAPLGLVLKAGVWYAAMLTGGGRVVSARVARVTEAVDTGTRFERPPGFDLAEWWEAAQSDFDATIQAYPVTLRLSPRALELLPHVLGRLTAERARFGEPDAEGWRAGEVTLESERIALDQITSFGPHVEVLAPPELRSALAARGRQIADRNS
ncbi:transcriptional regulator [Actinorhabdospora filicis]|uniref:Transcriptional regulator n=1 Tax=Actinorhabdospora filicis TaxID=1785913 RepID=A0A9W6SHS6_9ACTN|nr:WYL domain-containing protein [Actinorhabdospora filicis]GLZ76082.1 transcriptional regulator [Actinorhabdospora filicis]